MKKTKKKGFTLVELIVVIAIIAILAAVAVPLTISYLDKAEISATADEIKLAKDSLALVSTDLQQHTGKIEEADVKTAMQSHMSKPEHITVKVTVETTGEITATIAGTKFYNAQDTDTDRTAATTANTDFKVGTLSASVAPAVKIDKIDPFA